MRRWKRLAMALMMWASFVLLPGQPTPKLDAAPAPLSGAGVGVTAAPPLYLPLIFKSDQYAPTRRVNAPYLNVADVVATNMPDMAIFWFGKVNQTENYADVRVGYNNTTLYIYVAAFDRRLWYDTPPSTGDLTAWDSATVYVNKTGNSGSAPGANAYRFDAALSWFESRAGYQAAYQGNGSGWTSTAVSFTTAAGYRGDYNNNVDDKGSALTFKIPFNSLGLSGPPTQGTVWGLSVLIHDRDSSSGSPAIADKTWPEANADVLRPATWGQLAFGLPTYSPPGYSSSQTVMIRDGQNGAIVPDAGVGGSTGPLCGGGLDYWTQWGDTNYGLDEDFAVQNQSDVADFPCFAKYYVTFPLTAIPSGKVIITATLTLHQTGGSGPASNGDPPADALIQVMTVAEDWDETTITWNNAPLAYENESGRTWVASVVGCGSTIAWPCVPRTWDVSRAVARAYAAGQPLRLVLYSSDSAYSTGKYFTSSETPASWNAAGRPQLDVRWGNP